MKALEKFLTQKNRQANEDFIEKKFAEKRIKCKIIEILLKFDIIFRQC